MKFMPLILGTGGFTLARVNLENVPHFTQSGPPDVVFKPYEKSGMPATTKRAEAPAVYDRTKKLVEPQEAEPIHLEQLVGYKNIPFSEKENGFVVVA